jgi:hypothetical protein
MKAATVMLTVMLLTGFALAEANSACDRGPADFFLYDATPQAKAGGVNYPAELRASFRKDPKALHRLFRVSSSMDGSGAQTHAGVLWALLECWGDEAFAAELGREARPVRANVIEQLDYETEETGGGYAKSYPLTYKLGHPPKVPSNSTVDLDARKSGARGSP